MPKLTAHTLMEAGGVSRRELLFTRMIELLSEAETAYGDGAESLAQTASALAAAYAHALTADTLHNGQVETVDGRF